MPKLAPPPSDDPALIVGTARPAADRDDAKPEPGPRPAAVADNQRPADDDLRSIARSSGRSGMGSRTGLAPITIARGPSSSTGGTRLPAPVNRPPNEVPQVYQERVDPRRNLLARQAGATDASEKAVALALDWLECRHEKVSR